MTLHRLTVKLRSSLVTPLAADSLFGHWCWFVRTTRGEDALQEELQHFQSSQPPFRLSSGFMRSAPDCPMLPMPVWTDVPELPPHQAKQLKRALRSPLVPFDALIGGPVTLDRLLAASKNDKHVLPTLTAQPVAHGPALPRVRNTVNRVRGGTFDPQGFFEVPMLNASPGALFDIYFDAPSPRAEQLKSDFTAILAAGFGQDASTGAGFFDCHAWERVTFPLPAAPTWLALAPFVPAPDDPTDIVYSLATKYGKLGGLYAFSSYNNSIPWKTPILMMQPGALCFSAPPRGSIITNVHPTLPVIHYALCLAIPIDLPRSLS